MTATDTGTQLLRAIIAQPAEDTPRLVYADYLDENGEPERAEFIRIDVERHRRWPNFARVCEADRPGAYPDAADLAAVESRLMELVESIGIDALLGRERFQWDFWSPGVIRGFVESLSMPAADWLECADAILASHPVERVTLTTPDQRADLLVQRAALRMTFGFTADIAGVDVWVAADELDPQHPWLSLYRKRWPGVTFTFTLPPDPAPERPRIPLSGWSCRLIESPVDVGYYPGPELSVRHLELEHHQDGAGDYSGWVGQRFGPVIATDGRGEQWVCEAILTGANVSLETHSGRAVLTATSVTDPILVPPTLPRPERADGTPER